MNNDFNLVSLSKSVYFMSGVGVAPLSPMSQSLPRIIGPYTHFNLCQQLN